MVTKISSFLKYKLHNINNLKQLLEKSDEMKNKLMEHEVFNAIIDDFLAANYNKDNLLSIALLSFFLGENSVVVEIEMDCVGKYHEEDKLLDFGEIICGYEKEIIDKAIRQLTFRYKALMFLLNLKRVKGRIFTINGNKKQTLKSDGNFDLYIL